jgi:5-methylcytosine-specific restriction protein B
VEEDRLIGPYFLSDHERATVSSCKDAVAGKLLIYLWDDVLRHGLRDKIFCADFRTYSDLVSAYRDGKSIFLPATDKKLSGQEIPVVDDISSDDIVSQMDEEKVA